MAVVEIAVAAVAGYAWRKAKRAAGQADRTVDGVLDGWMQRLNDVVLAKAGRNPAIRALQDEAAGSDAGRLQVNQGTADSAAQVINWIMQGDRAFAAQLNQLAAAQPANAPTIRNYGNNAVITVSDRGNVHIGDSTVHQYGTKPWVIGGVLVVLLAVAGVVAYYFVPPYFYQRQVKAACHEAYGITTENHSEIVRLSTGGAADSPEDLIRINKGALLKVLNERLARVTTVFTQLDQESVPGSLKERKGAVDVAFAAWSSTGRKSIAEVTAKVRDNATYTEVSGVMDASEAFGGAAEGTRLNSAMGALAGGPCTAIGTAAVSA